MRDSDILVALVGDEDRNAPAVLLACLDVVVLNLVISSMFVPIDIEEIAVSEPFYL